MKAWRVKDARDMVYSEVVFAETRSKAKVLAQSTDVCADADWVDIRVWRVPELDAEYRGRWVMDWYDDQDRLALTKLGWRCEEVWLDDCETCVGRDVCETYREYLEGIEEVPDG